MMRDSEFQHLLNTVIGMLKASGADYVLITNRTADNGMGASNFGCKTDDDFKRLAYTLMEHSNSSDGGPVRTFLNALFQEVVDRQDNDQPDGQEGY